MEIKGYEILSEINRGAVTTVFLGRQTSLDRKVLIKVLNQQWQQEPDMVQRFRREAKICARLKHKNIVDIFDTGSGDENLYLIMEYIEGINLKAFIRKYHPIPFEILRFLVHEILNGLAYAHGQNIIHRDMKPDNIMISQEGVVKITDFGLAFMPQLPGITAQGGTVGTPAYMSPEQAKGSKVDHRSDLFSVGVTIYELASGTSPFASKHFGESIQKILSVNPPPLSEVRTDIPDWFSELVTKLMNKDPAKRPNSAKEILQLPYFKDLPIQEEHLARFIRDPDSYQTAEIVGGEQLQLQKRHHHWIRNSIVGVLALLVVVLAARVIDTREVKDSPPEQSTKVNPVTDTLLTKTDRGLPTNEKKLPPAKSSVPTPPETSKEKPQRTSSPIVATNREPAQVKEVRENISNKLPPEEIRVDSAEIAAAKESGYLMIKCIPWADIYINGEKRETTPLSAPLELEPGKYTLTLRNPAFAPEEREVVIEPGMTLSLEVTLQPAVGFLSLRVIPWAEVYVNGNHMGTTPFTKPLSLPAGKYEIRLVNPQYREWVDTLTILAGKMVTRKIDLQP
ncbi:MAG: PEGA domain-containing protein [Calditrichaeota bacterium]|nr:MAG: PEGA domain-containing protein [Calditrichota bacterium]